jgi:hypothetical protein
MPDLRTAFDPAAAISAGARRFLHLCRCANTSRSLR